MKGEVRRRINGCAGRHFCLHPSAFWLRHKRRSRFVHGWWQQLQAEPVAFKDIDQRMIKPFSVGQHARHELGGVIPLEPRRLIRLDTVGRAVRLVERIAAEPGDQLPDLGDLGVGVASLAGTDEKLTTDLGHDGALLLHQRPAQHVRPARWQPGKRLADLEDVLLVHHQPERAAQTRFQRRMRIGHRLQPLIAPRERQLLRFIGRTGPDDAYDGHQPVDLPHVGHAAETDHRGGLDVMHRPRAATGDHFPDVRVGEVRSRKTEVRRNTGGFAEAAFCLHPSSLDTSHRVAHDREAALREDVELHQPDQLDRVHVVVRRGQTLVRDERRRQFVHRLAGQHHPARVHLRMTRHAIEERGHLDGRLVRLLVERQLPRLRPGTEQFDQFLAALGRGFIGHPAAAKAPREVLGELAHVAFGHAQHLGHLGKRAARLERREPADHRALCRAVLREQELHHVVLAVVGEVHVDVGQFVQRHPLGVQEALEVEIEPDRADLGDAEAVAHQTVGRAAARDPADALGLARLQQIPHDQEVGFVTDRRDDAQFLLHLRREPGGAFPIAAVQPFHHELAQEGVRRGTVGWLEVRELRLAERESELAAFGDLHRMPDPLGMFAAGGGQFGGRPEVQLPVGTLLRMTLAQQRQRADALHDVILHAITGRGVMDRGRGHGREVGRHLARRDEAVERTGKESGESRVRTDGDQAAQQMHVLLEEGGSQGRTLPIRDTAFILCPSTLRLGRQQAAEVVIPLRRLHVEQQRLATDRELRAEDGLDPCRLGGLHELDRAMQVAGVRQRHGGQLVLFRQPDEGGGRKGRVEERVVAVRSQGDVMRDA